MTEARHDLGTRRPPPPPALARWLDGTRLDGVEPLVGYADAGMKALSHARSAPGRVRESAFQLLGADALLTYACEAALEQPDPEGALTALLRRTAEPI